MKTLTPILTVLLLLVIACEKIDDNTTNEEIQPLEVGYSWTYVDSFFTSDGSLNRTDTVTLEITGKEDNIDNVIFYWKWDFFDRIFLTATDENGKWSYGLRENSTSYLLDKFLDIKYPIEVGEEFESYYHDIYNIDGEYSCKVRDTITTKCISKDESFSTPYGDINCIVYEANNISTGEITSIYYSLGIGYVGSIQRNSTTVKKKKSILSYELTEKNSSTKSQNTKSTSFKQRKGIKNWW